VLNVGTCVGEPRRSGRKKKTCFDAGKIGFCHCAAVLQTQVPKLCTDLDLRLLYIWTLGTCSKFARNNSFLALGVCFPQPCSSAGRMFAAPRSRVQKYRQIVSFPQQKFDEMRCKLDSTENPRSFEKYPPTTTKIAMKCVVNWIPLRIHVRSRKYSTPP